MEDSRQALTQRLRRVEGQLRGVQRMIGEGQECEAVAHQLAAARRALDRAFFEMMACAVSEEVGRHVAMNEDLEMGVREMSRILSKYA
ncbi:MAG: metal-sensing transcriptional repressor [Algiphilus sp.]|uniref:metal-sensing transcriptional repressor n=1 Tax=Algiphilus sp. TaxID=1872431 RepID=UPI001CA785C6|nr:metal-sensing transcriptional repressor [Algiphilus sp.]MBY8967016.1 metal-sensing transcriptional repressor [Algiphilus acroporae]MCI5062143.1 metal-sensing transcriptional repressor [Algiphilus sp.]MCI5103772.1 metal-sensing transcriptional repressor [Algiphilus sp.]